MKFLIDIILAMEYSCWTIQSEDLRGGRDYRAGTPLASVHGSMCGAYLVHASTVPIVSS